jgi:hypothetical protein
MDRVKKKFLSRKVGLELISLLSPAKYWVKSEALNENQACDEVAG